MHGSPPLIMNYCSSANENQVTLQPGTLKYICFGNKTSSVTWSERVRSSKDALFTTLVDHDPRSVLDIYIYHVVCNSEIFPHSYALPENKKNAMEHKTQY